MTILDTEALYRRYVRDKFFAVMVQPTEACNLNCAYCYLPHRARRNEMSVEVAQAVADSIAEQGDAGTVLVIWHGGEPLMLGTEKFEALLQPFEELREAERVIHSVQTNATLITPEWCRIFRDYWFHVGVSIDGPRAANLNRVNWTGRPAFDRIMKGIRTLQDEDISFAVISVVSPETIADPIPTLQFLDTLGAVTIAFNLEEREGVNVERPLLRLQEATDFWRAVIDHHQATGGTTQYRELSQLSSYLLLSRTGRKAQWLAGLHEPGPAVGWDGTTVLLSPEFLGMTAPEHRDFVAGNVLTESLPSMLARAPHLSYLKEFMRGLAACETECALWDFCKGASAANRYFEHGTFTATETNHCQNARQAPLAAVDAHFQQTREEN
ncbi:cyclophane-forming radical SAM peptide maturase AmcB [Actinocorallia sp. A-T 12471]|uniref:cyclophane-forming radical SAM peptide maturase AmcB n=1 Tax=Actinocorallia sp. A-T 12471 TaxID=3089813 RepID=UPI0029CF041B|nr:cyclophane-forming radical SAM peptide maturase AmcB [Actinocorallia sp. A-T 12471]MDX6740493.1 cyclophane-forming radical SAM peptide maturase AmcB [Actinocorallia sp. A-T 12471]